MREPISLLDRLTYTYRQVDRLLGVSGGTARRWINGYRRAGRDYPPVLRVAPKDTDWVTWGEYVEARLLAGWRDIDEVPLPKLRDLVVFLRTETQQPYPLAMYHTLMKPSGPRIVWKAQRHAELPERLAYAVDDVPEDVEVEVATGQQLLFRWTPMVKEFIDASQFDEADTVVTSMAAAEDFPDIRVDPQRRGGEPVIRGRTIRAATIASQMRGGESMDNLIDWYDLNPDLIQQAVGYDRLYGRIA